MACNDGHAEPQDAALKTLRLFCRNPRCRQVLVSLGLQQRLVRFLERSQMSGACSQQSSVSSVPSTARTNDSVVSEHCVRILNKIKTRGSEAWDPGLITVKHLKGDWGCGIHSYWLLETGSLSLSLSYFVVILTFLQQREAQTVDCWHVSVLGFIYLYNFTSSPCGTVRLEEGTSVKAFVRGDFTLLQNVHFHGARAVKIFRHWALYGKSQQLNENSVKPADNLLSDAFRLFVFVLCFGGTHVRTDVCGRHAPFTTTDNSIMAPLTSTEFTLWYISSFHLPLGQVSEMDIYVRRNLFRDWYL